MKLSISDFGSPNFKDSYYLYNKYRQHFYSLFSKVNELTESQYK